MELLQKIDMKAAAAGQKIAENQPRSKADMGLESNNNKPFEEQLNKQIDQVKSKSNSQNNINNQQDNQSRLDESQLPEGLDESADLQSIDVSTATLNDAEILVSAGNLNLQLSPDSDIPAIDILLPDTGKSLPLSNVTTATQDQISELSEAVQNGVVAVTSKVINQQSIKETEKLSQHKGDRPVIDAANTASQNTQTLKTEVQQPKPVNLAFNVTNSFSDKINNQDARFARAMNENPASDVITQSTRLQQVPLTTAVFSSVATAQTLANAVISEVSNSASTGTSNNTISLSNTLSSSITANIQNSNWSQQMTQQVSYMIKGGFQLAEIKLNPAHLGPMEIKLSINDDQASVNFVVQHAPVRDVLDAAIPRLKEMLEQQGLNLADVDVSTQSEQQAHTESQHHGEEADLQRTLSVEKEDTVSVEQTIMVNADGDSGLSIFA